MIFDIIGIILFYGMAILCNLCGVLMEKAR